MLTPSSPSTVSVKGDRKLYQTYQLSHFIAKGNNIVYETFHKETKAIECIKEIKLADRNAESIFEREVKLLEATRKHPHPNIIEYKGSYILSDQKSKFASFKTGYIQMEKGVASLADIIEARTTPFDDDEVVSFIKSMIEAHRHLQTLNIAHRDIKPENIIVTNLNPLEYKVCDVGVGTAVGNENTKTRTLIGTIGYLSPELLEAYKSHQYHTSYNPFKSDVYSLGLVFLYFCSFRKLGFKQRLQQEPEYISSTLHVVKERYLSVSGLVKIIRMMLRTQQADRFDFIELDSYIHDNNLLRVNTDLLNSITPKFDLDVAKEDDNLVVVETLNELGIIEDMANHLLTMRSMKVVLNNLNKTEREMAEAIRILTRVKHIGLQNLEVELSLNELDGPAVKPLCQAIERCNLLQRVSVNMWNNKLKSSGISLFLHCFQKLLTLKLLHLTFSCNNSDDEIDFTPLQSLTGLEDLYLDLGVNRLTNQVFQPLLDTLALLLNLKHLTLNLETNKFLSSQPLRLFPPSLISLTKLQSLVLNLVGMSIRSQNMYYIASAINHFPLLLELELVMWNCEIKDKALIEFIKELNVLSVTRAKLTLWGNLITEKSMETFAENSYKFKNLQLLQINLSNNALNDQGIRFFNKSLMDLTALTHLRLSFDNTNCTQVGCRYIGRMLNELPGLKQFSLSMKGNPIQDEGLSYIVAGLKEIRKLKKLSLAFEESKITDKGAANFTKEICHLSLLEDTFLNFNMCELSESPPGILAVFRTSLKNLKQASFLFRRNPIDRKLISQILHEYQHIKKFDIKMDSQQ